jgi:hypothetical protein
MRVKALKTLGGAVVAQAGEEFDLTNEAQLRDLLNQGVVVPVENNAQEVARIHALGGEELAQKRVELNTNEALAEQAYAEAIQYAENQEADQREQQRVQGFKEARNQADQLAQQDLQRAHALRQAENQVKQMQEQFRVEQEMQKAEQQRKAAQRNLHQSQSQSEQKHK